MSDFFPEKESGQAVMLVFETVIDSLILNTSQASNSNIITQTLDFMDKHFYSPTDLKKPNIDQERANLSKEILGLVTLRNSV